MVVSGSGVPESRLGVGTEVGMLASGAGIGDGLGSFGKSFFDVFVRTQGLT